MYRAESDVFNRLAPVYGDRRLRFARNRAKLLEMWLRSDHFKRTGLNANEVRVDVSENCRNAGDFLRIVMNRMAEKQGVERWADNTNANLLHIPRIKATIPNALFVHVIRDGRDVATSMNHLGWPFEYRCPWDRSHGLLISALYWEWMVRKGQKYGRLLGDDYLEVHFEDLVRQPKEILKKLGAFIHDDLNYERIQSNAVGTLQMPNSSFAGATMRNTFEPIGRWKKLQGVEVQRMQALLGPLLLELGYEEVSLASLDFTARRMRTFYGIHRELKLMLKRGPIARFATCMDRFTPGFLDRETAYFESLQGRKREADISQGELAADVAQTPISK